MAKCSSTDTRCVYLREKETVANERMNRNDENHINKFMWMINDSANLLTNCISVLVSTRIPFHQSIHRIEQRNQKEFFPYHTHTIKNRKVCSLCYASNKSLNKTFEIDFDRLMVYGSWNSLSFIHILFWRIFNSITTWCTNEALIWEYVHSTLVHVWFETFRQTAPSAQTVITVETILLSFFFNWMSDILNTLPFDTALFLLISAYHCQSKKVDSIGPYIRAYVRYGSWNSEFKFRISHTNEL